MTIIEDFQKKFELWRRRTSRRAAYHYVYSTPEGELVLKDLMVRGHVLEAAFLDSDSHIAAYRDGRRSLALEIIGMLGWTEGELVKLAADRTAEQLAAQLETAT